MQTLVAAIALTAAGASLAQGVTSRTVVLGQSAPLSGPQRALGEEIRNGALAYLRALNDAGGVHGRRIELATLDDAGSPERALANTRRFIEEFGVFTLFAYPEGSATPAVLELAHKSDVPLVAPISSANRVRQPGRGVFAVRAGLTQEIDQIIGHYSGIGLRRMAIVREDGAGGAQWTAAARTALSKRSLPPAQDVVLGPGGPAAAARDALRASPDVLIVAFPEPPASDVVRALKRHGTGAQIVATSLADPGAFARALGAEGAGVSLAQVVPPLDRVSLPVVAEYRAAYAAEDGQREYSPASLEAFIGAKVLAEAVRRVGPALTREKLLVALEAMSVHDTGGHLVRFSRTSRRGSDRIYLLAIGRDGALLH
jgi:ABC-type branched-subunit amino acid transport system substrate-binding protein